jgi:hypothetical protein
MVQPLDCGLFALLGLPQFIARLHGHHSAQPHPGAGRTPFQNWQTAASNEYPAAYKPPVFYKAKNADLIEPFA